MIQVANHLWQSTLFAFIAALSTLALRNHLARTRHAVWLIASLKFLLPFSLLVSLGSHFAWRTASEQPAIPIVLEQISQPFPHAPVPAVSDPSTPNWPAIAFTLWLCGSLVVAWSWTSRWSRFRSALRTASVTHRNAAIPNARIPHARIKVMSSPSLPEPGVFGIFRPVLLLPEGIADRLTPKQLDAILTHELCHVRRRDNLTSALHMLVETIFWFHPLVWWIGARLVDERERACDEEVLRLGSDPQVYAESILEVCRFYLESPIACVSGITGADLKKRIEDIMTRGIPRKLGLARKLLLTAMAAAALVGPIAIGLLDAPPNLAQSPQSSLEFEVATIKPNRSGSRGFSARHEPGGLTATNASLQSLIEMAYQVKSLQISGAPDWLNSERFDIVAKAPPGATRAQILPMLRPLLADRFKLALHRESKVLPGYALVVAKTGIKLLESTAENSSLEGDRGSLSGKRMSLAQLADALARRLDRPVSDMTGIQGLFDLRLEWTPEESQPMQKPGEGGERLSTMPTDGPTIFTALQEQLGLKLEARKVPVEILVIDHVEKTPTEN